MCPFDYTTVAVSGKVVRTLTDLTTPVGFIAVTPTDRPTSVHNCCVSKILVAFLYVFHDAFWIFLWV